MEHLDKHECVYKLSRSVKTNRGVGKIAMTQKRLFLLAEGRPGYVEISTFRNIEVRAGLWLPAVGRPYTQLLLSPAPPPGPSFHSPRLSFCLCRMSGAPWPLFCS